MGQAYQLEASNDRYLLEDGSGVYLQEVQDVSLALTGQQIESGHGRLRADWHVESQAGQMVGQSAVPLAGESISSGQGTLIPDAGSPDKTEAITGSSTTASTGLLLPDSAPPLAGASASGELGTLDCASISALLGAFSTTESGTLTAVSSNLTLELTGQETLGQTGTLTASGGEAVTDDLLELQRQRRFGRQYRTLVRTPYRRTIR